MIGMYGQGIDGAHGVVDGDIHQPHHSVVCGDRYEFEPGSLDIGFGRYDIVEVGGGQKRQYSTA